ncbi:hypothetical protein HDU83_002312 [Entophlyctis luteolus]|nr:hypothetical protein HDU83_002312 [Entophlyctis luteolus]KAJ3380308.1 hypothetical protein HDU84_006031 [Entophlyctis sp. JEL0112]
MSSSNSTSVSSGDLSAYHVGYGCLIAKNESVGIPLLNVNQTTVSQSDLSCPAGWYCPNLNVDDPSTLPVYCPPTLECVLSRLSYTPCAAQGLYEPTICKPGHYCPTINSMIECPPYFYCPTGSVNPIACSFLFANCPAGTVTQQYYGFFILMGIADVGVLLVVTWLRMIHGHLKYLKIIWEKPAKPVYPMNPTELKREMHAITEKYRESLDGHDLYMNIGFQNLGLRLKQGIEVLRNVTGEVRAKRMTAIMGPSGAGKSTLMNVLMGKVHKTNGEVLINGQAVEVKAFKKLVGYVSQDDVMLHDLTVFENVVHSARIRLPRRWPRRRVFEFVNNILHALQLSVNDWCIISAQFNISYRLTHVSNSIIGDQTSRGISGGQRKRVSIAMELAAAPLAIFLDEPTSGLDATTSLDLTNFLQNVTQLGVTVVAVLHQPRIEIFRKFDDVILMVSGGRAAYIGPTDRAQSYFEALGYDFEHDVNPADRLMDILAGKGDGRWPFTPADLAEIWEDNKHIGKEPHVATDVSLSGRIPRHLFKTSHDFKPPRSHSEIEENKEFQRHIEGVIHQRGAGFFKQLYYCYTRSVIQEAREGRGFVLELVVATIAGCLIGVALSGKMRELISGLYIGKYVVLSPSPLDVIAITGFLMGVTIGLCGAPSAVKIFGEEKQMFWREAAAGHGAFSYYLGKTLSTPFRMFLISIHFAGCFLYFAKPAIAPELFVAIVFLQFYGVYGLSCVVSLIVRRENASILAVLVCLVFAVFCGYGPSLNDAKNNGYLFLYELSFNKWASEANYSAMIAVYRNVFDIDTLAASWGYTLDRVSFDLLMCAALGTIMRVLGFFLLIGLNRDKQR